MENPRQQLMNVGALHAAAALENDIRKEKRRMRSISREDPDVLLALARARDAEAADERKRRRDIDDANSTLMTRGKLINISTMRRCF